MKKIYILGLLMIALNMRAQQIPTYSQYMDNAFFLNPAAAGVYGVSVVNLTSRQQWMGIAGAPQTSSASYQGRILKKGWGVAKIFGETKYTGKTKGNVGMGLMVFNDRVGLIRRNGLQYSYAYHVFINETQVSLGLSAQIYQMRVNFQDAVVNSQTDPIMYNEGLRSIWIPDFATGVFVTRKSFFGGISTTSLTQSALKMGNSDLDNYKLNRHYYLLAGYTFNAKGIFIEPSILYKTTGRYGNQVDLSTKLTFKNTYWTGVSIRSNGDIIALLGIRVGEFYFGYAYDYATASFKLNTYGTHEISISYKIGSSERRTKWVERY